MNNQNIIWTLKNAKCPLLVIITRKIKVKNVFSYIFLYLTQIHLRNEKSIQKCILMKCDHRVTPSI